MRDLEVHPDTTRDPKVQALLDDTARMYADWTKATKHGIDRTVLTDKLLALIPLLLQAAREAVRQAEDWEAAYHTLEADVVRGDAERLRAAVGADQPRRCVGPDQLARDMTGSWPVAHPFTD